MDDEVDIDELVLVGRVWRAHALGGEVKIIPETDDVARFADLPVLYVGTNALAARPLAVENVRYQHSKKGPLAILKLEGIESRDGAEGLRNAPLYARPDDLPTLDEDEVFVHDLIGLKVRREDGSAIGVIEDVLELPGQEVLVIAREGRPSAMVPAVAEFVLAIDLDAETMVIRPIEGLLEE